MLPDVRTGAPDDTIETYVRAPGLGDWSPPLLTVTRVREMEGLTTVSGGRSLLLAEVARTSSTRGVRAVLMGADGAVQRRLPGPVKPTAPSNLDTRILPLGPARLAALLLRPAPPGGSRGRASSRRSRLEVPGDDAAGLGRVAAAEQARRGRAAGGAARGPPAPRGPSASGNASS